MTEQYEPGTVVLATVRGVPNVRAFCLDSGAWVSEGRVDSIRIHPGGEVTDVRPLVVLDRADAPGSPQTKWADIVANLRAGFAEAARTWVADQIEQQTRPPKPAEPTGLGAVVEDAEGAKWVRTDSEQPAWSLWGNAVGRWSWSKVNAVKVLSEGVTS